MIARLSCRRLYRQTYAESMTYELLGEEGPDHNKSFEVSVLIGEKEYGIGCGRTKKAAEQEAAYQTILMLRKWITE